MGRFIWISKGEYTIMLGRKRFVARQDAVGRSYKNIEF